MVVYVNNGVLFSHKEEENPARRNGMDEAGGHYGRQSKADTERQIPCGSLTRTIQKSGGHKSREWNSECQGLGGGENMEILVKGNRRSAMQKEYTL